MTTPDGPSDDGPLFAPSSPLPDLGGLMTVDVDGAVARVTLNRPDHGNALSERQLENLVHTARWLDSQPGIKVAVIDGAGRHFCAGADVTEARTGRRSGQALLELGRQMIDAIASMRAVTIAHLHGLVRGGGAGLAMACDLRFATDDATFAFPEARLGWPLPWGCVARVVRELGPMRAKDLILNSRLLPATQLVEAGVALFVGPPVDVDAHIADTTANLLATSSVVLESVKAYVEACADAMVPASAGRLDRWLMMAAQSDAESRQSTRDGLRELLETRGIGPMPLDGSSSASYSP